MLALPGKKESKENLLDKEIQRQLEIMRKSDVDSPQYKFAFNNYKELHGENEINDIADWLEGDSKYFLQAFEDSGNLINDSLHGYDENQMRSLLNLLKNRLPRAEVRGL